MCIRDRSKSRAGTAIQLGGGKQSESAFGGGDTGGATGPQRTRYQRTPYIRKILEDFQKGVRAIK